jgi:hypothetical protein
MLTLPLHLIHLSQHLYLLLQTLLFLLPPTPILPHHLPPTQHLQLFLLKTLFPPLFTDQIIGFLEDCGYEKFVGTGKSCEVRVAAGAF